MTSWSAAALKGTPVLRVSPDNSLRIMTERHASHPFTQWERALDAAGLHERPIAVVDLEAFDTNIRALRERAGTTPIRVVTKSLRVRALIERAAQQLQGGIMAFTVREALDLHAHGFTDIVVAYPSADRAAIAELAAHPQARGAITLMCDSLAHGTLIHSTAAPLLPPGEAIRIALELDVSYRPLTGVHIGAMRSPIFTPRQAKELARALQNIPSLRIVGLMGYEGQIAGAVNRGRHPHRVATRIMQTLSAKELRERRVATVAAVREVCDLEFVNGGGTGSVESTAADPSVTEVAAGSGLLGSTLFDQYHHFTPHPALFYGFAVVRRSGPHVATLLGGGWIASGPVGPDRNPVPVHPPGLRLARLEGAGEVQTPVVGKTAARLRIGDTVWMRHAKAGEGAERINSYVLMRAHHIEDVVPTYRGDGHAYA